jgi:hypothetical protein
MSLREYKPRLSVEITERQDTALRKLVPHNMKSPMIRAMLDTLIHLLGSMPDARLTIITLIIAKEFDLAQATYERVLEGSLEDG